MRPFLLTVLAVVALAPGCLEAGPQFTRDGLLARPVAVSVDGERILLAGSPFVPQGVHYAPYRPGDPGRYDGWDPWEDLVAMKGAGVNAVRLDASEEAGYGRLLEGASALDLRVAHVLRGPGDEAEFGDAHARGLERTLRVLVARHAGSAATFLWEIADGPERDPDWLRFVERAARIVEQEDPRHPLVVTVDTPEEAVSLVDAAPTVPILGVRGFPEDPGAWGETLERFRQVSGGRPLLVTAFGADAWDDAAGREDAASQAAAVGAAWDEIAAGYAGGFVEGWTDRWDRSGGPGQDASDAEPDVEWLGLHAFVNDTVRRRPALDALRARWAEGHGSPPSIVQVADRREGEIVRIEARVVTHAQANATVELLYRGGGTSWETTAMAAKGGEWWEARLLTGGSRFLFYKVHAVDAAGFERMSASAASHEVPAGGLAATLAALALAARRLRRA